MSTTEVRLARVEAMIAQMSIAGSQDDEPVGTFGEWCRRVSPELTWDWPYLELIDEHLDAVTRGEIDRLMVLAPPRHGKSSKITIRYPVYRLVLDPRLPVIVAAHSATLAQKFSRMMRRLARLHLTLSDERTAAAEWETTAGGGVRAVGAGEAVAGAGGRLICVDDPIRNAEEADSLTFREKAWEWWTADLYTRREPGAATILTLTHWNEDDIAGRILASDDAQNWTVLTLPALAEEDDLLGREPGQALCPERYDEAALEGIRDVIGDHAFEALYQQRPTARKGDLYDPSWFELVDEDAVPNDGEAVLWFDRASTEGGGDYTAGCLGVRKGPTTWLWPLLHCRKSAGERDRLMRNTADMVKEERPRLRLTVRSEQEPGSGGKDAVGAFVRLMIGHTVRTEPTTGSKESRGGPMASQAEHGNVKIVKCPLARVMLEELRKFPRGTHDDMAESGFSAFNVLARSSGIRRSPTPKSTAFWSG